MAVRFFYIFNHSQLDPIGQAIPATAMAVGYKIDEVESCQGTLLHFGSQIGFFAYCC